MSRERKIPAFANRSFKDKRGYKSLPKDRPPTERPSRRTGRERLQLVSRIAGITPPHKRREATRISSDTNKQDLIDHA